MPLALIVEDDPAIADIIRLYLANDGFTTEIISDGLRALQRIESAGEQIDLILLDLMLPGLDGRGVCRRARRFTRAPIIIITALDDAQEIVEGLDLGADDYVTKPFNPHELLARIRAVMRRSEHAQAPSSASTAIEVGAIRLDTASREVHLRGHLLELRTREFDLLEQLVRHHGQVLTREQLLERVWGGELHTDETRTVDIHISRLRDRLAPFGQLISIETIRSVGYRLRTQRE